MANSSSKTKKFVRTVSTEKRVISVGLLLSLSISLVGSLVYADNTFTAQNNSPVGGIFGGVGNLVQSTVTTSNHALLNGPTQGILSPVTGAVNGIGSGVTGAVGAIGTGVSGAVNGVGLGGTVNGISGGANGIAGGALGTTQTLLNNVHQSNPGQIFNGNVGININGSLRETTKLQPGVLLPNGIAQAQQVLPVFSSPSVQSVRGLNVLHTGLIGSALQAANAQQFAITSTRTHLNDLGAGKMQLLSGSVLLSLPSSRNSVLLETVLGNIWVGKQSNVLVNLRNGLLQIQNLDSAGQNVRFQMAGSRDVIALRPGFELLASTSPLQLSAIRPLDGVARRHQIMLDNNRLAVSEINLASLIKNQPLLSSLQSSSNTSERRVFDRLVKTAAILDMTRGRAGFLIAGNSNAVTEIAGQGLGTASRAVGTVVSTAGQTASSVLAALSEGQIPAVPNPPSLPGGGIGGGSGSGGSSGSGGTGGGTGGASGSGGTGSTSAFSQSVLVANSNINSNGNSVSQLASGSSVQSIVPTDQTRVNAFRQIDQIRRFPQSSEQTLNKKSAPLPVDYPNTATPPELPAVKDEKEHSSYIPIYGPFPLEPTPNIKQAQYIGNTRQNPYATKALDQETGDKVFNNPLGQVIGSAKETVRRFPDLFLALGLVIAGLMVLSLALARAAFLRARELEASNARLAAEIAERKQLEVHTVKLNEDLELRLAELAQLNQDLESARDQAVEGSRLKSEFVANISHEIRTPISAVIGMNQLLLNTPLDDKQKDYARLVNESAQSLLTVINDILDFSKIEAGKLEVNSVAFSLDTVMKEVSDILASSAQAKGLKLFTFIDPEVNNNFRGDPARLRQVLINLAGNAVKFTALGEVVINVTRVSGDDKAERVKFTVQDSGIGISPEAQTRLFQPFVQADGSTTRRYGGTGLGLSISKRLVELMGGEIHIQSEEGKGSTFWFELPAWAGTAGEPARIEGTIPPNKRVLILSPQSYFPEILSRHLEMVGLNAEILRSGEEAAIESALKSSPFSAILVDSLYATALSKVIEANPDLAKISIAFLRDSDSIKPPLNLQVSPLTTPLTQHDLVRWMVSLSRGETDKPTPVSTKADKDLQTNESSFSNTRILVAEDSLVLQRMVKSLLEKLGCTVEIVANGKEAVEAAHSKKYNMIFMDWQMPEMDGLEATKTIRSLETSSGQHIPIIAMTANAMQGDKDTCLAAGMDGYMSKPFKLDDLRNIISQYASADDTAA